MVFISASNGAFESGRTPLAVARGPGRGFSGPGPADDDLGRHHRADRRDLEIRRAASVVQRRDKPSRRADDRDALLEVEPVPAAPSANDVRAQRAVNGQGTFAVRVDGYRV